MSYTPGLSIFVICIIVLVFLAIRIMRCLYSRQPQRPPITARAANRTPRQTPVVRATTVNRTSTASAPPAPETAPSLLSPDRDLRRTQLALVTQQGVALETTPDEIMADFGQADLPPISTCSICLLEYTHGDDIRRSRHCPHMFHSQCILDWLVEPSRSGETPSCPCCRKEFVTTADLDRLGTTRQESAV